MSRIGYSGCQEFCPICERDTVAPGVDPGPRIWIPAFAGMTDKRALHGKVAAVPPSREGFRRSKIYLTAVSRFITRIARYVSIIPAT
jgi:hypothetical protein